MNFHHGGQGTVLRTVTTLPTTGCLIAALSDEKAHAV
jgi:hypothetical protein